MNNREKTKEQLEERLKELEGTNEMLLRTGRNNEKINKELFEVRELLKKC